VVDIEDSKVIKIVSAESDSPKEVAIMAKLAAAKSRFAPASFGFYKTPHHIYFIQQKYDADLQQRAQGNGNKMDEWTWGVIVWYILPPWPNCIRSTSSIVT
jgi:hypothetical protein